MARYGHGAIARARRAGYKAAMTTGAVPVRSLEFRLADPAATARLAAALALLLRPGDVLALQGDLGSGKTAFARALIQALSDEAIEVPSPTFTLVQTYATAAGEIWHFDLYRLGSAGEARELGIEDAFLDGISLIEWPDRLGDLLPAERLEILLQEPERDTESTARLARLTGTGSWLARLARLREAV